MEIKFDDIYASKSNYFSPNYSGGMADCLLSYKVKPCLAIDLGAGEGRNSFYLASLGFDVIAIEPSIVGSNKILSKSKENNYKIKVENSDFLSAAANLKNVGFLVALTSLEHMEYEYMIKAIKKVKEILASGAYIYILAFTEDDPGFKKSKDASECAAFVKHYFRKNELKEFFSDFEVLLYDEYIKKDTTHGEPHFHGKAKLFARKP